MNRFAFLYNPAAKGGKSGHHLVQLKAAISSFDQVSLFISKQRGDIATYIDEHFADYDVFVACGGDGTVREVADKLLQTPKKMGIVPMGTGNDLCKTLKIPASMEGAISLLEKGSACCIDVGICNDFIFLNTLGFGFDGLTNRYALQRKQLHPIFAYTISALKAVINHKPFKVSLNEKGKFSVEQLIMVTLANGRVEGGSFWVAPNASIKDGQLNLITIEPVAKWLIPFLLPFFLIKRPSWIPYLKSKKVDQIVLEIPDDVEMHADGEMIRKNIGRYNIRMIDNGLNIICGLGSD